MGYVSYQEGKHTIEGFDSPQFVCRIRIEEAMLQVEVWSRLLIGSRIHQLVQNMSPFRSFSRVKSANEWICLRWLEQVPKKIFHKMVIAWWVSKHEWKSTLSKSNIYRYYWFIPFFRPRYFTYSLHWYVDTIRDTLDVRVLHAVSTQTTSMGCWLFTVLINIHDRQWNGNNPCVSN